MTLKNIVQRTKFNVKENFTGNVDEYILTYRLRCLTVKPTLDIKACQFFPAENIF